MKTLALELPMLYADHHVLEVRRLMFELDGVSEVYASSAFHTLEVLYDEEQLSEQAIRDRLEEGGYLGEMPIAVETQPEGVDYPFFRKSAEIEQVSSGLSFAQQVSFEGRPLWPCPGLTRPAVPEDER